MMNYKGKKSERYDMYRDGGYVAFKEGGPTKVLDQRTDYFDPEMGDYVIMEMAEKKAKGRRRMMPKSRGGV
jgi:hypothetical protein